MIRCAIYRGGTSKGVMFRENDLPAAQEARTAILLRIFGSPDVKQIDGLGGATMQTSKAMLVGPSQETGADVQMTFAQVSLKDATVDWDSVCGNMTSAVGPFAINEGMVRATEPVTSVRIYSVNSKKYVTAHVPVKDGKALSNGNFEIPGVPGTGARIELEWMDPGGSITGKLLPTGNPRDEVTLSDGRRFTISIVDAGNLTIFCDAKELGLCGTELPAEFDANQPLQAAIEEIRSIGAEMSGLVPDRREATRKTPGMPKIGFVAAPAAYAGIGGKMVAAEDMDILARLMSAQLMHKSYMGAGAVCTSAAAAIEGTVVNALRARATKHSELVRIGHPAGVMSSTVKAKCSGGQTAIVSGSFDRTARRIMEGYVFL
jgi:2-methylaconitate cis-trans-isomerase PrpF